MRIPPVLSGIEIGIPLNILSKTALNSYNHIALPKQQLLFNFILGYSTYKGDRFLDALEWNTTQIDIDKKDYYLSLIENKSIIEYSLFCTIICILTYSIYDDIRILPLYISTLTYKYIKKFTYFKSLYISLMWTFASCILPLNYYPLPIEYLPTFFNIFALTNFADIKDYDEDIKNNINTLPTILGKNNTIKIILLSAFISNAIFLMNDYSLDSIFGYFFLSSNIFPYISYNSSLN